MEQQSAQKFFAETLDSYIHRAGTTIGRLAKSTGIPKQTLEGWKRGATRHPREVIDILKVGRAIRLTQEEADDLLRTAGYPTVADQFEQASQSKDEKLLELLHYWTTTRPVQAGDMSAVPLPPFQALPAISDFTGREAELKELGKCLRRRGAICVIHGMGGVGKTSLATRLAYMLRGHFPDGVLWANLKAEPLSPEELLPILGGFAQAYGLDVREQAGFVERSRLVQGMLADKRVLIVLDNAHASADVLPLLPPTGRCSVLITTRNHKLLDDRTPTYFNLLPFNAKESLAFLQDAAGKIGLERVAADRPAAQYLVERVGGLPLALRIIVGFLKEAPTLSLAEYNGLLAAHPLDQLSDWEDAARNVRACFAISYQHLPITLQGFWSNLSIFEGRDFSVEAAAAVQAEPLAETKLSLGRLHALSLIDLAGLSASTRYRLHPLLQTLAREKLGSVPPDLYARLTTFMVQLAQERGRTPSGYTLLDEDWENIRAVLQQTAANGQGEILQNILHDLSQVVAGLVGYLDARGYWQDARRWFDEAAAIADSPDVMQKAFLAFKQGVFTFRLAEGETAATHLRQSLDWLKQLPTNAATALCQAQVCGFMGQVSAQKGFEEELAWLEQGLGVLEEIGSNESLAVQHERGYLLIRQGQLWGRHSEFAKARELIQQGITLLPDTPTAARVIGWTGLGVMHAQLGEYDAAAGYWQKALADVTALGDVRHAADLHQNLAILASHSGQFRIALTEYESAAQLYRQIGEVAGESRLLSNATDDYMKMGDFPRAHENVARARDLARRFDLVEEEVLALINSARLQLFAADVSDAPQCLDRARQLCREHRYSNWMGIVERVSAELSLRRGETFQAQHFVESALALLADVEETGVAWRVQGEVLKALEQHAEAEVAYRRSLEKLDGQNEFEFALTQKALGLFYAAQERWDTASEHLTIAAERFASLGLSYQVESIRALLTRAQRGG